jgi:hypothetical protein
MDYEVTVKVVGKYDGGTWTEIVDASSVADARRQALWNARHSGAWLGNERFSCPKIRKVED